MCQSYHDFFAGGNVETGLASAERSYDGVLVRRRRLVDDGGGWLAEVDLGEAAEDQGRWNDGSGLRELLLASRWWWWWWVAAVTAVAQLLSGVTGHGRGRRGRVGTGRIQCSRVLCRIGRIRTERLLTA